MNMSISQLELLSKIVEIEPQAAFCAFTAGFKKHKVTYTMRAIPDIFQHLQKPNHYVQKNFIPALVDGHIPNGSKGNCYRYL